jgi:6-phosphofructokinase 1
MERAFICHSSQDSKFIIEVCRFLRRNLDDIFYYEDYQRKVENAKIGFEENLNKKIVDFEIFIAFIGKNLTDWQKDEISILHHFQNNKSNKEKKSVIVVLLGIDDLPSEIGFLVRYENIPVKFGTNNDTGAYNLAKDIINGLGLLWKSRDGLPPISNYFKYEKDIIKDYIDLLGYKDKLYAGDKESNEEREKIRLDLREKLLNGLPPVWPKVKKMPGIGSANYHKNTVNKDLIGEWRPDDAKVVAAALTSFHPNSDTCIYKNQLTFPEAGPREFLFYPRPGNNLKVAILVSGGIAPGINSVINGITQRHELYANESEEKYIVEIYGLRNGFYAFDDYSKNRIELNSSYTSSVANESGSCIGTSRDDRLLESTDDQDQCQFIIEQLLHDNIDILYIIGGDGSMKAAHALWNYSKEMIREPRFRNRKISIIGIPKTMDNDILWVWQTFGFLSAVEKAREIIEQLSAEVISNPRICIVQLFGSDSGFVVSHAVVASKSTVCDVALIPEVYFTMKQLAKYLIDKIESQRNIARIPMSLIVMAETAIPLDALDYVDDPVIGLTNDEKNAIRVFIETKQLVSINKRNDFLRTAGLKIVSRVLKQLLPDQDNQNISWSRKRVFTNEPRHLLRTTSPSCSDTIMGNRLGTLAVDNALAGYSDFMISQWLTEYVLVPLKLVVLGKKRIPTSGIFWKSVTTKTGQPDLNVVKKNSGGGNIRKKK